MARANRMMYIHFNTIIIIIIICVRESAMSSHCTRRGKNQLSIEVSRKKVSIRILLLLLICIVILLLFNRRNRLRCYSIDVHKRMHESKLYENVLQ